MQTKAMTHKEKSRSEIKVVVLIGSGGGEFEISYLSGENVFKTLSKMGYSVEKLLFNPSTFAEDIMALMPSVVFNAMHGGFGEDGYVPAILNKLHVAYTHSGYSASRIGLDKIETLRLLSKYEIPVANHIVVKYNDLLSGRYIDTINDSVKAGFLSGSKFVIKPIGYGSSVNVVCVDIAKDGQDKLKNVCEYLDSGIENYMVEEFCAGREFNVVTIEGFKTTLVEAMFEGDIYGYYDKFFNGWHDHDMPDIDDEFKAYLIALGDKVHEIVGCKDVSRSEFRVSFEGGKPTKVIALEINTHPGMTEASFVTDVLNRSGDFENYLDRMVENASYEI